MKIRNDWLKYRSETLKYDPVIFAAEMRKDEFKVPSQWTFSLLGPEGDTMADAKFGWIGIDPEKSCPTVNEYIVLLKNPKFEQIARDKIISLYYDLPWVPILPIRFLNIDEFFDHHRLPHLDGWYESDTEKVHYCLAYQDATGMPFLESKCGKWRGFYYYFRDPIPYVEPEYSGDICKSCIKTGVNIEVKEIVTVTGSIFARIDLSKGQTFADFIDQCESQIHFLKEESAILDYVHVEVIGANWSLLLAHECAQQVQRYCNEHFSQVENYVTYL
jgi:hypothetical protein